MKYLLEVIHIAVSVLNQSLSLWNKVERWLQEERCCHCGDRVRQGDMVLIERIVGGTDKVYHQDCAVEDDDADMDTLNESALN